VIIAASRARSGNAAVPESAADVTVAPRGQTEPTTMAGDRIDDPAIWIHPTDADRSLILGTDKKGGLNVYDLDGRLLSVASPDTHPDNVDVLYDFPLADGVGADLAVAATRSLQHLGLKIWCVDPDSRSLTDVAAGPGGVTPTFGGTEPYGSCVYRSAKSGHVYAFVNNKLGRVEQYELKPDPRQRVTATRVRAFDIGGQVEGCVADHELGRLYVSEELRGVWRFDAEPTGDPKGTLVVRAGEHGLVPDVEGLTLYAPPGGRGYLIVSSQGNSTFKLYDRAGDNRVIGTIRTRDSDAAGGRAAIDAVSGTDGIDVCHRPFGRRFPKGLFVAQDDATPAGRQNFKLFAWDDIAGDRLLIDTSATPPATRPRKARSDR
jgi:3-phytase